MPNNERPWYQKKRYIIPLGIIALWGASSVHDNGGTQASPASSASYPTVSQTNTPATPAVATPSKTPVSTPLSNNNYYTNSSGNQVHSPAYAETVPVGATAECRDGSYSFSRHRRGICSHHGGVAEWL